LSEPTRLPLISRDQAALTIRHLYPDGDDPSNVTKTLAGSPDTLAALAPFLGQVMNPTTIDYATKEIVVVRVSALNRCDYCVPTHEVVARRAGVSEEAVAACIACDDALDAMEPAHRCVARYCDELVRTPYAVSDGVLDELREHFADHEIVELTALAGAITLLNYVASVAQLPLDAKTLSAR
jgi:AhpD family alkylhydroperoxidase